MSAVHNIAHVIYISDCNFARGLEARSAAAVTECIWTYLELLEGGCSMRTAVDLYLQLLDDTSQLLGLGFGLEAGGRRRLGCFRSCLLSLLRGLHCLCGLHCGLQPPVDRQQPQQLQQSVGMLATSCALYHAQQCRSLQRDLHILLA